MVQGIRAGLEYFEAHSVRLIFENIGFGGDSGEVYAKAESLILNEKVRVIVAYLDATEGAKLDALCTAWRVILLVIDPGGHVPVNWNLSPWRCTVSLQGALGCRMTGRLAAEEGAETAAVATSFYEGGYLQNFSLVRGFESGGGRILSHVIVPYRLEDFNINPWAAATAAAPPDAMLGLFSAEAGEVFLKQYAALGLRNRFYASPFMLEETWLATITWPVEGIRGYVPWLRKLDNPANRVFVKRLKDTSGAEANVFSMVGWEAAQFIVHYLNTDSLHGVEIESPRGALIMHPASGHWIAPMYLVAVVQGDDGAPILRLEASKDTVAEFETLAKEKIQGVFSKWLNTYLCV